MNVYIERDGQLLEVEIDAETFKVDDSDLDAELCRIGKSIFEYGTIDAEVKLRVGRLEAHLESTQSLLDSQVRDELRKSADRATEAKIHNTIIQKPEYQEIVQALTAAHRDAAVMRWVMTALTHKSEALRALAFRDNQLLKSERK